MHRCTQEVKADVLYPNRGVYLSNCEDNGPKPYKIEHVKVSLREDLMRIWWKDDKNPRDTVKCYEVEYDEQNNLVLCLTIEECELKDKSGGNTFWARLKD